MSLSRTIFAYAAVLLFAASFASSLPAQQAGDPATGTQRADTVQVAPIVVTVSRLPVRLERTGFSITQLGPEILAAERPTSLPEVLRLAPGVFMDEGAGPGGPTIVRLRGGEEVFTQVLLDGVQANENGGYFDMQGLVLSNVERVEVARGPQSAVHGSSAVSGVVNIMAPRGRPGAAQGHVTLEGGGATEHGGGWRATGTVRGGTPALLYSAGAGAAYERGVWVIPNDMRTRDASLRLDAFPHERFGLTGVLRWVSMAAQLPVRDPGATRVPLDPNAKNERDRIVSSLEARFATTSRWTQHVRAALYTEDFEFQDRFDNVQLPEDAGFFLFDANLDFTAERSRMSAEYGGRVELVPASARLGFAYGVVAEREEVTETITGDFTGNSAFDRPSVAGYGEVLVEADERLAVLAGVRVEKFEGLAAGVTPRLSASYQALPAFRLRGAVGRAFKAPNLRDQFVEANPFLAPNPDLRPETSVSVEAGADLSRADGRASLSLTAFHQSFDDLIRTIRPEGADKDSNVNVGKSRARGVEWSLGLSPSSVWGVGVDGAWVVTDVLDNQGLSAALFPENEELPFRPGLTVRAFLEAKPLPQVSARLTGRFVDDQIVFTERFGGQRVEVDSYLLLGLATNVRVREGITLFSRADNLLDRRYETAFDREGIPLSGRIGVEISY